LKGKFQANLYQIMAKPTRITSSLDLKNSSKSLEFETFKKHAENFDNLTNPLQLSIAPLTAEFKSSYSDAKEGHVVKVN
jgi:hypothetical protein